MLIMSMLFVGGLLSASLLLPGEGERIAMLERDGRSMQAKEMLEKRFAAGDRSQRTLYQLQEHYLHLGDLEKSRQTLEMLAAERPRDAQVQRRLALFYKQTQDEEAYLKALRAQASLRYSENACRELIGLLRRRGAYDEEQATIQQCRQRGYRRAEDLVRLAALLSTEGDLAQSVQLLRSADDLLRLKSERDRMRLFAALLEIDQPREAVRRALRWVRASRGESSNYAMVDTLVDLLVRAKRYDVAIELVRGAGTQGDGISLIVGELMLLKDEDAAARAYLRGWLERAEFTDPEIVSRFIRLAVFAADPENALRGAEKYGLSRLPQEDLVAVARALARSGNGPDTDKVRAYIKPDIVALNIDLLAPVFAAPAPAPRAGQRFASSRAVARAEPTRELDAWRLELWTRMMPAPVGAGLAPVDVATLIEGSGENPARRSLSAAARSVEAVRVIRNLKKARRVKARPAAGTGPGGVLAPAAPKLDKFDPNAIFGNPG